MSDSERELAIIVECMHALRTRDTGELKHLLKPLLGVASHTQVNQVITRLCDEGHLARVCMGKRMYLYTREEIVSIQKDPRV